MLKSFRFAKITNPRLIEGKNIFNRNIIFNECWMNRPYGKNPLFNCNLAVVKECDLGFMYYGLSSELMPEIKTLILDVPYFEIFVRGRFPEKVEIITRSVYPYSQVSGISYVSKEEIAKMIQGMEEDLISTLD